MVDVKMLRTTKNIGNYANELDICCISNTEASNATMHSLCIKNTNCTVSEKINVSTQKI